MPLLKLLPDELTYNGALKVVGSCQQWQMACALLSTMQKQEVRPSQSTLRMAISITARQKKWRSSLSILADLRKGFVRDRIGLQFALQALSDCSLWEQGVQVLLACEPAEAYEYAVAMSACNKKLQWERAVGLLEHFKTLGLPEDLFLQNAAIRALGTGSRWREAMILFAGIGSPDQVVATSMVAACGSQWRQGLQLLARFEERRLRATLLSHTPLVRACGEKFEWSWGLRLVGELQEQAVRPDNVCSTTAIKGCSGEEMAAWSQALVLFNELQGADLVAYGALMWVCGSARQWQCALRLFSKVNLGLRADSATFSTAISACKDQWQHALGLLAEYLSSMRLDMVTLNATLSALATGAQWQRAIALQICLNDLRMQKDIAACNAALSACERSSQWEVAVALLETQFLGLQLSLMSYNLLASSCAKAQRWIEALNLLVDLEGNAITKGVAINALSRGLRWPDALHLLMTMPSNVVATGTLLNALQQVALWPQALSLLRTLKAPSVACYDYVLMASPRPLAFQLLLESYGLRSIASCLWGLVATQAGPHVIHAACVRALRELQGASIGRVATVWWAAEQLGASNAEFQERLAAQAWAFHESRGAFGSLVKALKASGSVGRPRKSWRASMWMN